MVNIPDDPFRVFDVGDDHPLVSEALRPRRHFESCWCGSGRKYKKCHRIREEEIPWELERILHEQQRVFWRPRGCMHPHASQVSCNGKVIDAHTIQRKGILQKIVDQRNHVCQLDGGELTEIGWKRASVFPGYCASHDATVFEAIEKAPFLGTHEQCVLQAYRSVCSEVYKKTAAMESLAYQRDVIDRGSDINEQISQQLTVSINLEGQSKSRDELQRLRLIFENAVTGCQYDRFRSQCYFFTGELCITSSGALHAEFSFSGERLSDTWDLSIDGQLLCHSVMSVPDGGAIVFTWLAEENDPAEVVASFDAIRNEDKGDLFAQYCFLNCENTYFSRAWWEGLRASDQATLKRYAAALSYDGGAYIPFGRPLVPWKFGSA